MVWSFFFVIRLDTNTHTYTPTDNDDHQWCKDICISWINDLWWWPLDQNEETQEQKKNSSLKTTNDGDRQNIDLISSSMMIMISNHHYYWKRHENENQIFWHKMWFQVFNDHVGSSHLIFFVVWLSFEILDIKATHTRLHEMRMFFFIWKNSKFN